MNKAIKKTIFLLLILLMGYGIMLFAYGEYNNKNREVIVGGDIEYNLETGARVWVVQGNKDGHNYPDILNQPNVFCVEHGKELDSGRYKVSKEYTVSDNILAYILNHGPEMGKLQTDYKNDKAQLALWMYLYNAYGTIDKSKDVNELLDGITCIYSPKYSRL